MSFHKVIEAFYPYFNNKKEDAMKMTDILGLIDKKHPTAKVFLVILRIFNIGSEGEILQLFEKLGPSLEYIFGDDKCCSLRWGVDTILEGKTLQKRCISKKSPGFLYCTNHRKQTTQVCDSCLVDAGKEIVHGEYWEHFGSIFDSALRPIITHNYKKLGTTAENHILYSSYLLFQDSFKGMIIDKPIVKKPAVLEPKPETKPDQKRKPKLLENIAKSLTVVSVEPKKIRIDDDDKKILETALYYYVLSNGYITPKNIDKNDILEEINIYGYDEDDYFYHDSRFIYKKGPMGFVGCGIYLNGDSCILLDGLKSALEEIQPQKINYLAKNINNFQLDF